MANSFSKIIMTKGIKYPDLLPKINVQSTEEFAKEWAKEQEKNLKSWSWIKRSKGTFAPEKPPQTKNPLENNDPLDDPVVKGIIDSLSNKERIAVMHAEKRIRQELIKAAKAEITKAADTIKGLVLQNNQLITQCDSASNRILSLEQQNTEQYKVIEEQEVEIKELKTKLEPIEDNTPKLSDRLIKPFDTTD